MNPFEQQGEQSRFNIVTIQNIDTHPFLIEYDSSNPMTRYVSWMQPQEVRRLPKFIADHAVNHMISQVLNRKGQPTNHAQLRPELAAQIVIGEEKMAPTQMITPEQKAVKDIDTYNKPSDLEQILAKRKAEEEQVLEVDVVSTPFTPTTIPNPNPRASKAPKVEDEKGALPPDKDEEEFVGLKDTPVVKAPPTRDQLYIYATKDLGMDLDKKTMNKFKDMTDEQLAVELDYPTE